MKSYTFNLNYKYVDERMSNSMYEIGVDFIQKLKKSNVSRDGEKTKSRFQQLWKDASKDQKAKVLEDADIVRATIYRIYNTGAISAKIVVAASQAFNISPYYITGEADEPGEYSLDAAKAFLIGLGYEKLVRAQLPEAPAKQKRSRAVKPVVENEPESVQETEIAAEAEDAADIPCVCESCEPSEPEAAPSLEEEEIILLLRALAIRSKVNPSAKKTLDGIIAALMA